MTKFDNLAASSHGAGFQYYDVQDFSFTKGGVFLPLFSGSYAHSTSQFTLPKNRFGKAVTDQILTNVMLHCSVEGGNDVYNAPGVYHLLNGTLSDTKETGSSGGFPVFYAYNIYVSSDANNLIFTIDVGNPSGVNDVTSESITIDGKVFFYLAPF